MSARARIAFAAVSTLWGIPYLFIKIAVDDGVPPVLGIFCTPPRSRPTARSSPRPATGGRMPPRWRLPAATPTVARDG